MCRVRKKCTQQTAVHTAAVQSCGARTQQRVAVRTHLSSYEYTSYTYVVQYQQVQVYSSVVLSVPVITAAFSSLARDLVVMWGKNEETEDVLIHSVLLE